MPQLFERSIWITLSEHFKNKKQLLYLMLKCSLWTISRGHILSFIDPSIWNKTQEILKKGLLPAIGSITSIIIIILQLSIIIITIITYYYEHYLKFISFLLSICCVTIFIVFTIHFCYLLFHFILVFVFSPQYVRDHNENKTSACFVLSPPHSFSY